MSEKIVKVFVNLEKNQITIQTTEKRQLFNQNNRYVIEGDKGGCSFLSKQRDEIHHINQTYSKGQCLGEISRKTIKDEIVSKTKAKELIREVVKDNLLSGDW